MRVTDDAAFQAFTGIMPPAVILAAGEGSRLNGVNGGGPKPLTRILGLTLLERAILSCREIGVLEFCVVVGYRADRMISYIGALEQRLSIRIQLVENVNWKEGNGSSALSAAPYIRRTFLLLMCDHLFDPAILRLLLAAGENTTDCLLAVDRRTDRVFDLDDATRVQLDGDAIIGICKGGAVFDAVDTGLFLCPPSLFRALEVAKDRGRHSLSAGLAGLIRSRELKAVAIGERFWLDVDTPMSLRHAKRALLQGLSKPDEDGFIARYLNRPLSRRLTEILVRFPIRPNGISLMSFAVSIMGAVMFSLGGYVWTILAGLAIQLASIVDGCDGEVARLKFQSSEFGGWFDTMLDRYADTAIVVGVSFGYWLAHPHSAVWMGAIFALSGFTLASYVKKEYEIRYRSKPPGGLLGRLIKRDLRIFAIMLGALANLPYQAMLVVGFLSHVGVGWILLRGHRQMRSHRQRENLPSTIDQVDTERTPEAGIEQETRSQTTIRKEQVTRVIDGDIIDFAGRMIPVRLANLDALEASRFGRAARDE